MTLEWALWSAEFNQCCLFFCLSFLNVILWGMMSHNSVHSQKQWFSFLHNLSIVYSTAVMGKTLWGFPIWGWLLRDSISCSLVANKYSYHEYIIRLTLPCQENGILKPFSLFPIYYILLAPSFSMFTSLRSGFKNVLLNTEPSTVLYS